MGKLLKPQTRTADSKGRVLLGEKFANRVVIIQEVDPTEVTVTLARAIPDRELWLYDNRTSKAAVFEGIEEARNNQLNDGPDWSDATALADSIPDELEADDANVHRPLDAPSRKRVRKTEPRRPTSKPSSRRTEA